MPELGENITEGTVTEWFKTVGESVNVGEALFGVSTDKVDAEVPSPLTGTITEIRAAVGQTVAIGTVVASLDEVGAAAVPAPPVAVELPPEPPLGPSTLAPESTSVISIPTSPDTSAPSVESRLVTSPVVRKLINDLGDDAARVIGTGPDGRVTRRDAERVAFSLGRALPESQPSPSAGRPPTLAKAPPGANFVAFNKIRKITGERTTLSKAISPHVITAVEVDYERVEAVRRLQQQSWKRDEGFTLTYLPFIARAVIQALDDFPHMNASVVEGGLVVHEHVDLNVAVDLNFEGLIAPVIRRVEDMRLGAIARAISDVAARARGQRLRTEDLTGGTFTLSNSGSFGTFMVAPVINQPQVAILSTDGVTRRPVVVTDADGSEAIAIHSVGLLVLTWDHRAFDGAYAAAFLRRVKDVMEHNDWMAEF